MEDSRLKRKSSQPPHPHTSKKCSPHGSTSPEISGAQPAKGSFPPSRIFWLFLSQVLSKTQSCRETLQTFLAWLASEQGETASPNTAAYCKARLRLSIKDIQTTHRRVVRKLEDKTGAEGLWFGRKVRIVDGSSVSMPDTPENQEIYPQPSRQKKGCGFPIMRITALFSLASGAMLAVAKGSLHVSERELFRSLWKRLRPKDVVLADRGFCGFAEFLLLLQRGVDCVMRNHPRRTKGITHIKWLGKDDRLIEWHKMVPHPKWFSKKRWAALPERLLVREIWVHVQIPGFRTSNLILVTTLLDPKAFPKEAFAELYRRRWNAELHLRDIKTTMGMNILRCKTPEMIEKELAMHVIAYNLIRALMIESAQTHHIAYERLSFKGSISTVRQWAPTLTLHSLNPSTRSTLYAHMLFYIAKDQLPYRPNRVEPRAIKRRPSGYQFLMQPRHVFKEIPHRRKYRKA
jgi:hypothetical protein